MSRAINRAPLAVTTDGTVLVNAVAFDVPKRIEALIESAMEQRGAVFIGIVASPAEVRFVLERAHDATYEAACLTAGRRQKRNRARRKS